MGKMVYVFSSYNFEYDEFTSKFCLMRKKWFEKSKYVRECFKYASEVLMYDFSDFFSNSNKDNNSILNAHITYFVFSYAMFEHLSKTYKLKPKYFLGFGLGEVTALCASGIISFSDGLKYVSQISNSVNTYYNNGGFVNVKLSGSTKNEIAETLENFTGKKQSISIVCNNYFHEITLTGQLNEICTFLKYLNSDKKITKYLYYNYYNNKDYDNLIQSTKKAASQVNCNNIKSSVIYSLKNRFYNNDDNINNALAELFFSPVNITNCVNNLTNKNIDSFIELSPDNMIENIVKDLLPDVKFFSALNDKNELIAFMKYKRSNVLTIPEMCITVACTTKNNNCNSDEYRKGVIEPYLQLKKISNKNSMNKNIAQQSIELLHTILETKGLSLTEINSLINNIILNSDYNNFAFS